jgi:hypothetical protein
VLILVGKDELRGEKGGIRGTNWWANESQELLRVRIAGSRESRKEEYARPVARDRATMKLMNWKRKRERR